MPDRTLKLTIEYDGTNYYGWQVQPKRRTVQGEIEGALARILHHPVRLNAGGRTDAGVHATGQVASFATGSDIETVRLLRALNGVLSKDATVVRVEEASPGFHARFGARSRTYRYTMSDRRVSVGRNYVWRVRHRISRGLLEEATRCLEGPCDLRGFSKAGDEDDFSTVVLKNRWTFSEHLMIFEITAVRFFHHSVRSIVGTAMEVGRGKEPADLLARILETGDRSLAGPTAPACGLCLVHIDYGDVSP